jgi:hypothetical protein
MFEFPEPPSTPAARLRAALDLFEDGVAMMRASLRRRHPAASEDEMRRLLREWLYDRPGAEQGDSSGRPRAWIPTP